MPITQFDLKMNTFVLVCLLGTSTLAKPQQEVPLSTLQGQDMGQPMGQPMGQAAPSWGNAQPNYMSPYYQQPQSFYPSYPPQMGYQPQQPSYGGYSPYGPYQPQQPSYNPYYPQQSYPSYPGMNEFSPVSSVSN